MAVTAAGKGQGGNWLQTIPGKSGQLALRIFGPEKPWIDGSWRPGEIELVKQEEVVTLPPGKRSDSKRWVGSLQVPMARGRRITGKGLKDDFIS